MNGADTGAGQHGVGRFGDHGHVDDDTVAFFHAPILEHVTELAHFLEQLLIADVLVLIGFVAFPDNRGLRGALRQVAVYAVIAGIQGGALEPGSPAFAEVPFADGVPGGLPVQKLFGALGPERVRVIDGLGVPAVVGVAVHQGLFFILGGNRMNVYLGHLGLLGILPASFHHYYGCAWPGVFHHGLIGARAGVNVVFQE